MKRELSLKQKKISGFSLITIGTLFLSFILFKWQILEELENRSWDWRLRSVAKQSTPDANIKIIVIDQSSLEYMEAKQAQVWPWPRQLYIPIIKFLETAGAKAIAFDIMYTEESRYGVDDDLSFAESMQGTLPVVVSAAIRAGESEKKEELLATFRKKQFTNLENTRFTERFPINRNIKSKSINLPINPILKSSDSVGNITSSNDSDGVFRHFIAGQYFNDIPVLTLPFALYNAANSKTKPYLPRLNDNQQLTLRYAGGSGTYKSFAFKNIFNSFLELEEGKSPGTPLSEFKDSYVLVGMNAPGLLDLRPTPLDPKSPGVEINATALDNLINQKFIREANLFENLSYTLIFILLSSGTALFIINIRMQLSIIILSFTTLIITSYYAGIAGLWIQLIVPILASSFSLLSAVALQYRLEGAQTRFIKKAFRYYVSPEVIEKIIENPSVLSLGGDRKELSIYFCDIKGFTSISEAMDPSTLVQFLNKFLSAMTTIILSHGGTVDKYVGDAIVAFWNAPLPDSDHAKNAVLASIECQSQLDKMRQELFEQFGHQVWLRIGIHTGLASVGNFGSLERFNYTVIGDAANLASRLEGANKSFGTDILISEATYLKIKEIIPCMKIAMIKVVGKDQAISVYSPNRKLLEKELLSWNSAVESYEQGQLNKAKELFCLTPETKLKDFYMKRIEQDFSKQNLAAWSPILELNEK